MDINKSYLLKLQCVNKRVLDTVYKKLINSLNLLPIEITTNNLPTQRTKYTVLKSPHVNKKARDQYEQTIYSKRITCTIKSGTGSTPKNELLLKVTLFYLINQFTSDVHLSVTEETNNSLCN